MVAAVFDFKDRGLHQQVPDDDDALILSFWLLGLAPSSLGLQELASQVGSINYPWAMMASPA